MASPVNLDPFGTDISLPSLPNNLLSGSPLPVDIDGRDTNHQQHLEAYEDSYEELSR